MSLRFPKHSLVAAAALVLAACASAPTPPVERQNVVLVHGAWMDASSWDRVAADLRERGYSVTAVQLPGHGGDATPAAKLSMQAYTDAVVAALPADRKSMLVGHSMAGMVISAAAEKAPERVALLVYVAGYLPSNGDSMYKLSKLDKQSLVPKYWTQADPKGHSPASIRAEGIVVTFCADCSPADQGMLVATHKAEPVPPLATPVALTAARFGSVPRVYVHTTKDNAVTYPAQQLMVQQAGGAAKVLSLDSSHAPMLSQPKALADAIDSAAR